MIQPKISVMTVCYNAVFAIVMSPFRNSSCPCGPIPHNMAKTFDGPPTLERSGSEHRVGRFTSFLLRRKAWLEVELPLERETEGFEKSYYNNKT